jgi:branched-chain amino acid transport system permease protein
VDCLIAVEPSSLINQLIAGISTGGVYALVGLGLVLIYKTSHVVNFAQGELLMWGAYLAFALVSVGLPFPAAILGTLAFAGVAGGAVERMFMRRMIGWPVISAMIVTLGLASLLRGLAYLFGGTEVRRFPDDLLPDVSVTTGLVRVPSFYVWSLVICVASVVALMTFFRFSRLGLAMRAAADDQYAALSMGIRISRVLALSWALSAGVAAIGGVLLANLTGVNFTLADLGLAVLPVVILGGLDSIPGAIVGGLVLGSVQNIASGYLDPCVGGGLRTVVPFLTLLVVVLIKPHGLFGRVHVDRV